MFLIGDPCSDDERLGLLRVFLAKSQGEML